MRGLTTVTGRLIDVRRYIHVPMRWCGQYPARERWELWVRTSTGDESKLTVHSRYLPARRGHRVSAVMSRHQVLALLNLSTGQAINFCKTDPALIWKRCDGARLLAATIVIMVGVSITGRYEWLLGLPCLALVSLIVLFMRWARGAWMRRRVQWAVNAAMKAHGARDRLFHGQ